MRATTQVQGFDVGRGRYTLLIKERERPLGVRSTCCRLESVVQQERRLQVAARRTRIEWTSAVHSPRGTRQCPSRNRSRSLCAVPCERLAPVPAALIRGPASVCSCIASQVTQFGSYNVIVVF